MTDGSLPREYDPLARQFDALGDPIRRRLLVDLFRRDGADRLDWLPIDRELAECREVELYHAHLPRLARFGYVEWDDAPLVVRRGPSFDEIEPLLELLCEHSDSLVGEWPRSRTS